jgi:hypothetical protein
VNRCSVRASTLHSSVFARLATGAFYETIVLLTFYEFIKILPIRIGLNDHWPQRAGCGEAAIEENALNALKCLKSTKNLYLRVSAKICVLLNSSSVLP